MNDDDQRPNAGLPPADLIEMGERRAAARARRDWADADALKARIEERGWKIVDHGTDFVLAPARPPDEVVDGVALVGAPTSVVSRQGEQDDATTSVVVIVDDAHGSVDATIDALSGAIATPFQLIVIAARDVPLKAGQEATEVIRTAVQFTAGQAFDVVLRRATGRHIVVLRAGYLPGSGVVTALIAALADPDTAIVGTEGRFSADLRRFQQAGPGRVAAVAAGCYAFRRRDGIVRGGIDQRLQLPTSVATWWSLRLREATDGSPARSAWAVDAGDGATTAQLDEAGADDPARAARRDAYRIGHRFASDLRLALTAEA